MEPRQSLHQQPLDLCCEGEAGPQLNTCDTPEISGLSQGWKSDHQHRAAGSGNGVKIVTAKSSVIALLFSETSIGRFGDNLPGSSLSSFSAPIRVAALAFLNRAISFACPSKSGGDSGRLTRFDAQ